MTCPRCRITHEPEWYKQHYEEWFNNYCRYHPTDMAAKLALKQVQKHAADAATPMPLWMKMGLKVGGGEVKEGVTKTWKAVDGKKTAIGAVLTFLVLISPQIVELATGLGVTQGGMGIVTSVILVVGVAHKVWKKFFGAKDGN